MANTTAVGVSSFGYAGTIAHVMLGKVGGGVPAHKEASVQFKRHLYVWRAPAHPFTQRSLPSEPG
eukprot:950823-Prymnesium_polylepis.1